MENDYLLSNTILFDAKPVAVPYSYRLSYRMAQLLLIMSYCSPRGGSSVIKLNLISTALFSKKRIEELINFANNPSPILCPVVRFDPAINRALLYSIADGLVEQQKDGKLKPTKKGKEYIEKIRSDESLFLREKEILSQVGNKITEAVIKDIVDQWRY